MLPITTSTSDEHFSRINMKFELMFTRRAKAIAVPVRKLSVYLESYRRSSFLTCALQPKIATIKTPYFGSSGSFKVIDVNTTKMLVTGACCDRQHAVLVIVVNL